MDLEWCKNRAIVRIGISCQKLRVADFDSSDPYVVVYIRYGESGEWKKIGETAVVWKCLNPRFVEKFSLIYDVKYEQYLKFCVFDKDKFSRGDKLGTCTIPLDDLYHHGIRTVNLRSSKVTESTLTVTACEVEFKPKKVTMKFAACSLPKMDLLGSVDPYLEISRLCHDGKTYEVVAKTEYIKNTKNPEWNAIITTKDLLSYQRQKNCQLKLTCYDHNSLHEDQIIGDCETNLEELQRVKEFKLEDRRPCKTEKLSGKIILKDIMIEESSNLMYQLKNSCCIVDLSVAVDFSGFQINHEVSYKNVLRTVVEDLLNTFNRERKVKSVFVHGMGVKPTGSSTEPWDLFALNDKDSDSGFYNSHYVEDILREFDRTVQQIAKEEWQPAPAGFAAAIRNASHDTRQSSETTHYRVLLIVSNGSCTDIEGAKQILVQNSTNPLSVVIVEIVDQEPKLKLLDGRNVPLKHFNQTAKRGNSMVNEIFLTNQCIKDLDDMASEICEVIHDQIVTYLSYRQDRLKANNMSAVFV